MLKILLIDDEEIVLNGLEHVLARTKRCEIVGKLRSAKDILQVIRDLKPHVIITDIRMPEIDGLELLKCVKQQYPHIEVIMLTGHAEFEYARQALRLGARDYLLKPCRYKQIEGLLKALEEDIENQHSMLINRDKLLSHEDQETLVLKDIIVNGRTYEEPKMPHCQHYVMVLYYKQRHIQSKEISQQIRQYLRTIDINKEIKIIEHLDSTILLIPKSISSTFIINKLYHLKSDLVKKGIFLYGSYSDFFDLENELHKGYMSCLEILDFLRFNEERVIEGKGFVEDLMDKKTTLDQQLYDDGEVIKYVFLGKDEKLLYYLNNRNKELMSMYSVFPPCLVRNQIKHQMILIEKRLREKNITFKQIFGKDIESIMEIEKLTQYTSLINWFKNMVVVISQYMRQLNKELPKSIQDALTYIGCSYNMELSMNQVAEHVHLNPWYFSELFKLKVGVTFSDYLTQIRIQEAKNLLKNTVLKNYEIADLVGFKNAAYFNVVFKKYEGTTPKVFRKNM